MLRIDRLGGAVRLVDDVTAPAAGGVAQQPVELHGYAIGIEPLNPGSRFRCGAGGGVFHVGLLAAAKGGVCPHLAHRFVPTLRPPHRRIRRSESGPGPGPPAPASGPAAVHAVAQPATNLRGAELDPQGGLQTGQSTHQLLNPSAAAGVARAPLDAKHVLVAGLSGPGHAADEGHGNLSAGGSDFQYYPFLNGDGGGRQHEGTAMAHVAQVAGEPLTACRPVAL